MKETGIIFDMDNTILSSRIDFAKMRQTTLTSLKKWQSLPAGWQMMTTSQLVDKAVAAGLSAEQEEILWQKISDIEWEGLHKAVLEPGVAAMLEDLAGDFCLTLLTNNMHGAAVAALQDLGVAGYFSCVAGRGQVPCLKPKADGVLQVMAQFPTISQKGWLAIGDAWIDAAAAQEAGIAFAAYNHNRQEEWALREITPCLQLSAWQAGAVQEILAWRQKSLSCQNSWNPL